MARTIGSMILALFVLGTFMPAEVDAEDCTALDPGSESQLISYLTEARQKGGEPECVVSAIKGLSNKKTLRSAELLANYLDYKRPLTRQEQAGIRIRTKSREELYPAISALFSIGKGAVPGILYAISNTQGSTVKWDNAIYTLMLIYRDDPVAGVGALRSSAATNTGVAAERLSAAASDAARLCSDDLRSKCMDAASSGRQ